MRTAPAFSILVAIALAALPPALVAGPILDAGWALDTITEPNGDETAPGFFSVGSPYVFELTGAARFRIVDVAFPGDVYQVWEGKDRLVLTTSVPVDADWTDMQFDPDKAWNDPIYSHGEFLLGAGRHELWVKGDGKGGFGSGFYSRIDSVPDAGGLSLSVVLLWAGLLGVRRIARRAE